MTTVQSQTLFQPMPAAVAMDIDPADLVEAESCHGSCSSSFSCRTRLTGVCTARAELGEVQQVLQEEEELEEDEANGERDEEEGRDSFLQLQVSVSAATGECGDTRAQEGEVADCMAGEEPGAPDRGDMDSSLSQVGGSEEIEMRAALASEAAEGGGTGGELPFSKQLISFSLFGKLPPKSSKYRQLQTNLSYCNTLQNLLVSRATMDRVPEFQDSRGPEHLQKYSSDALLRSFFHRSGWHWSVCCRNSTKRYQHL